MTWRDGVNRLEQFGELKPFDKGQGLEAGIKDMRRYILDNFAEEFVDYILAVEPEHILNFVEGNEKDYMDWFRG